MQVEEAKDESARRRTEFIEAENLQLTEANKKLQDTNNRLQGVVDSFAYERTRLENEIQFLRQLSLNLSERRR